MVSGWLSLEVHTPQSLVRHTLDPNPVTCELWRSYLLNGRPSCHRRPRLAAADPSRDHHIHQFEFDLGRRSGVGFGDGWQGSYLFYKPCNEAHTRSPTYCRGWCRNRKRGTLEFATLYFRPPRSRDMQNWFIRSADEFFLSMYHHHVCK